MHNLTVGPPTRLILAFTVPLLIGNLFQQLYTFTDAAVVGRLLGLDALAAVGASGSLLFLLVGFSWGASAGLAIPVSRAFGAGDMAGVRRYTAAGAYASAGIAAVITGVGVVFARDLLTLLNTPAEIIDGSTAFLTVSFAGAVVTVAFNFLSATIRALGDSRTPLYFLIAASMLNAVLSVLLVGAFGWGVSGAAAATVFAQLASVVACLVLISRKMPTLHLTREDWAAGRRAMAETLRTGLPMGFQMSVIAVGALVLQFAVNGLGAVSVAAFTAAMRVDAIAVAPLNSFGIAMVTFTAQNRGARQWRRIRIGTFRTSMVAGGVAVALGLAMVLFAQQIVGLVIGDADGRVLDMARTYFLVNGGLYAALAALFVLRAVVQGMGMSTVPTIAGALELVARAAAGVFLVRSFGFVGVAWAAPLAWFAALLPVGIAWARQRRVLLDLERADDVAAVPEHALPEAGGLPQAAGPADDPAPRAARRRAAGARLVGTVRAGGRRRRPAAPRAPRPRGPRGGLTSRRTPPVILRRTPPGVLRRTPPGVLRRTPPVILRERSEAQDLPA